MAGTQFLTALLLLLFISGGYLLRAEEYRNPVMLYHDQGKVIRLEAETDSLFSAAIVFLKGCDLRYRMAVSDSLITWMKKHTACLEILYNRELTVRPLEPPAYRIDRLLIPVNGVYATDHDSKAAVIFLGNRHYFSGPIGNSRGLPIRQEMQRLVALALQATKDLYR